MFQRDVYSRFLHDAFYLFCRAYNDTVTNNLTANGENIFEASTRVEFKGLCRCRTNFVCKQSVRTAFDTRTFVTPCVNTKTFGNIFFIFTLAHLFGTIFLKNSATLIQPPLLKPPPRRTYLIMISKLFFTAAPIPSSDARARVCVCVCVLLVLL